jgi:uncharacterized repeat protein (TIGR02543 family)
MEFFEESNNTEETNNVVENNEVKEVKETYEIETPKTDSAEGKSFMKKKGTLIAGIAAGVGAVVLGTVIGVLSCNGGKDKDVTVRFMGADGTNVENIVAEKGAEVALPTPEKEGFKFEGWYTNESFEGERVTKFVANGDVTYYAKWTALCAITSDLNGGSLSDAKVYVEKGVSVYDAVKDLVPTKTGLIFGAWFYNGKELDKNVRAAAEGIALKAEYKVEYTVEIYLENLDGNGYPETPEKILTESDYVGKKVTPELDVSGCTQVAHAEEVLSTTLSDKAAENVLKAYFNRNTYTVTFDPNYPGGGSSGKKTVEAKYGAEVPVPSDVAEYMKEGYCMLGWSTSASGDITYPADLDSLLHNVGGSEDKGYTVKVERTTILYGVWKKGMTDVFGGDDYLYYVEGMGETIYLARGDVFFKGEYNTDKKTFKFKDGAYTILDGKLLGNDKYLYTDDARSGISYLYEIGKELNERVTLYIDNQNGITYTEYDENGDKVTEMKGTYTLISEGEYEATFTEKDKQPITETMSFLIGKVNDTSAFQIGNDEERNAGTFKFSGIMKKADGGYAIGTREDVTVQFDGYGTATWLQSGSKSYYNYQKLGDGKYRLTDSSGNEFGVMSLNKNNHTFFVYDKKLDTEIQLGEDGVLKLDGMGSATYTLGNKTFTSYYTATTMPMGSTLIALTDDKDGYQEYKFLLTFKEEDATDENGEVAGTVEVVDTARKVLNTYAEYYYKDVDSLYYAPMLVLDEEEEGWANVYGYTAQRTYLKVSVGTYTKLDDGTYLFEREDGFDYEYVQEEPINLSTVDAFVFQIGNQSGYSIHYWYSFNGVAMEDNVDYTAGEATLKLVGGFAYYKATANMNVAMGAYTKNGDVISFTDEKGEQYYIELNGATFTLLDYAPYTAYLLGSDNKGNSNYALKFNGKGGATYVVNETETAGTIAQLYNGDKPVKTLLGEDVYQFTADDNSITFAYIQITSGGSTFYLVEDTAYAAGEYTAPQSVLSGTITLDGYCYEAKYVDGDIVYDGKYYVEEGVVYFQTNGKTYVLDKAGEQQFTLRGEEYGYYAYFTNEYFGDLYFEFDGYGKLSVFTLEKQGDEYVRTNEKTGTYDQNGNVYTLIYGEGADKKTYVCEYANLSYKGKDGKSYKVLSQEQTVERNVLIDTEDWAVLILDEFGGAIKYDAMGQKQTGRYTRITDKLVYFVNSQGTDACLYDCEMDNGAASPIELTNRSYYTSDLKALNFTKYGFAIFNGDTENLRFYQMDGKNVVIYRRPLDETEEANTYGFVEDRSFGVLGDKEQEYNGETYYKNGGADIDFNRVESNLSKYPVIMYGQTWTINTVTFAPAGGETFQVSAKVNATVTYTKDGQEKTETVNQNCSVVREDGELYILIAGAFRLYINATFAGNGGESTFEAYELGFKQELSAYRYLDIYYRLYASYGPATANSFKNTAGTITLEMDFDENGKEEKENSKMSASFGEDANLYDSANKNLTELKDKPFIALDNGLYYVETTMDDGYVYRMYFGMQTHPVLRATGYLVYAFVRMQEFTVNAGTSDEYTVSVGRTITSEVSVEAGSLFSMELKNASGTLGVKYAPFDSDSLYKVDDTYYYVDRKTNEDGEVISATYYTVRLTENAGGAVEDENRKNFTTYQSAEVIAKEDATIKYEENDKKRFVEIVNGEVRQLNLYGNIYYAKESTYDEATKTYTVVTTKGTNYKVQVVGDYVVVNQG